MTEQDEAPVAASDDRGRVAESVQEYVDSAGASLRSDPLRGVLRGVKLLGLASRNGRRYEEAALRDAMALYEGAKVNVNHPARDPLGPRDYRDRLGAIRSVRFEAGQGLFGDLHYNPKHPLAEQLAWDAANAPQNVGLSHNVLAHTRRDGAETVVEGIVRVQSVDLVADPATTAGLFEQVEPSATAQENERLRAELQEATDQLERLRRSARVDALLARHGLRHDELSFVTEAMWRQLLRASDEGLSSLVEGLARVMRRAPHHPTEARERDAIASPSGAPIDTNAFLAAVTRPAC